MPKTAALAFRIEAAVKAALEKAARDDARSLSSLMEKIIGDWLGGHGYLEKPKPKPKAKR
jgi:hypothetical protein